MKAKGFSPKEILFSITTKCNLRCAHCDTVQTPGVCNRLLDKKAAIKFLNMCTRSGIKRVGFTGGEPFLALDAMCAIIKEAAKKGMLFGRIMTNGGWFDRDRELVPALHRVFRAGYDGDICLSVDIFHKQSLKKCALFIKCAAMMWRRGDIVSIAAVKGAKDNQTIKKLKRLAKILHAKLIYAKGRPCAIKNENIFVRIFYIELSPVGRAHGLKDCWKDGKWFKDDFCAGPGNIFFVLPDGEVKPCCGYGFESDIFTIGDIKRDSPGKILKNALKNRFIKEIFTNGLHPIRKKLESSGVEFPGKTTNHCFFCNYMATRYAPQLEALL